MDEKEWIHENVAIFPDPFRRWAHVVRVFGTYYVFTREELRILREAITAYEQTLQEAELREGKE